MVERVAGSHSEGVRFPSGPLSSWAYGITVEHSIRIAEIRVQFPVGPPSFFATLERNDKQSLRDLPVLGSFLKILSALRASRMTMEKLK